MELTFGDIFAFVAFFAAVIGVSLYASRKEETSEDYFLAGRGLSWWLIGFSLIASNISSEHFVGMSGEGFDGNVGLAIASFEWFAAVSLVVVALFLLPKFLKAGIYTIPEFLEYRYNPATRALMAVYMVIMYVVIALASILYAGAVMLNTIFDINLTVGVLLIGFLAGTYTIYGGLKAVVWTDLFQGAALLIGGAIVMVLGFKAVGGVGSFMDHNADKLHMFLPADHPTLPWTALLFGIWIPNLFYWGLNQFITQRTLAARSLAQGQRGIIFAAFIKLIIPFIIVFPGIMAYQLYSADITDKDQAYPYLIKQILPSGLRGIMFAALFGAVMSSLDSMLNSASAIFTLDLYKRHLRPDASPKRLIFIGRIATAVFVVFGCVIAPLLDNPKFGGIFNYIQKFQGFISPGIVAAFFFGLIVKRAPAPVGLTALLLNIPVYGLLLWKLEDVAFLNHMGITFAVIILVMSVMTFVLPAAEPREFPVNENIDLRGSRTAKTGGAVIVIICIALYIYFR